MKNNTIQFLIISFLLTLSCQPNPKIIKNDKLNVLFIIADDLNCDIGGFGNKTVKTPNIDRLIKNGIVFENTHCQYPLCGPSRASIMTGMYSDQTKITQNNVYLRNAVPDVITIGQRFRQQGYQSVRIGKIFHYDNPSAIGTSGTDDIHTWDQTINPYGRDKVEEYKINTLLPRRYGGTLSWLAADGKDEEQTDGIGATEAINQLENFSKNGQNFFSSTGGTHACARIDISGSLISIAEDIGRHNAMDKLIGDALNNDNLPIREEIVVISGRASFELVQKSLRAGFPIMIAIGAPSSLAIDLATEHGMTLIGFAKKNKITIFSGSKRIQ